MNGEEDLEKVIKYLEWSQKKIKASVLVPFTLGTLKNLKLLY